MKDAEVELAEDLTPSEQVVQQDDFNVASVDLEGHLMESWPDSASDSILASAMRAMFPFGFAQLYPDGSFLVAPDEPFQGIFQIEAGSAELMHLISEADSDEEEVFCCNTLQNSAKIFIKALLVLVRVLKCLQSTVCTAFCHF